MRSVLGMAVVVLAAVGVPAFAQRGVQELPPPPIGGPRTPFEQFADRLDLNGRTQRPEAEQIFVAAAAEALPIAQQMNQLRIRLVNAEIAGDAAEAKTIVDAYTAVAARMAETEADAFAKVYALLNPNQQKRAAEAFHLIGGVFVPKPSAAPARGRTGGRGGRGGR